ncbi:MAG: ARMT1-like domain-containing protein [Planctomycetota bacterium]
MSPFVQLADPSSYVACKIDLVSDDPQREYWCDFFPQNVRNVLGRLTAPQARKDACIAEFDKRFAAFKVDPRSFGNVVTMYDIDVWREDIFRRHGFDDPFAGDKASENAKMLPVLPSVLAHLDELDGDELALALVRGVFAGNVFDMGAPATAKTFQNGGVGFEETRDGIKPRPWLIDDFDTLRPRLVDVTHKHCVYFVDNAGSDVLLGALPFMRHLARHGCRVTIAANKLPALNDVTAADMRRLWPEVCEVAPSFADLPIQIVCTGTGEPQIDLLNVSDELNEVAADADLVVLEGMGRGIETNLDADLRCDRLNLAMLKDEWFAKPLGGELYDVVCRYVPA